MAPVPKLASEDGSLAYPELHQLPRSQGRCDPVEATLQPMQEASAEPDPRFSAICAVPAVPGAASAIELVPCDHVEASVGEA